MFWRQKKRIGRPADGPRPDLVLPTGDWPDDVLSMHRCFNQVVAVIMADDENLLETFPIVEKSRNGLRKKREGGAHGGIFETDAEGERGYLLRYAQVTLNNASADDREAYCAFYYSWLDQRTNDGSVKGFCFHDEAGEEVCWRVGEDDFLGMRLEYRNDRLLLSATRAWVFPPNRERFDDPQYYAAANWTQSPWKWSPK